MAFTNGSKRWLTPEELTAACSLALSGANGANGAVGPHPDQSVRCVRELIRRWATNPAWPLGAPDDKGLVVLAVDSLGYGTAVELLSASADEIVCLTSMFPSTSTLAWVSSVTGASPRELRVSGPVGLQPGVDGVYNILRSCAYTWEGGTMVSAPARPDSFPALTTAFDDLTAAGWGSDVLVGDFNNVCARWTEMLIGSGRRVEPTIDVAQIRDDGQQVVRAVVDQVDRERAHGPRRCIWAYVNLDEHAHRHGYDAGFRAAVRSLAEAADRWAGHGHSVVLYSDHGQVPNRVTESDVARFDAVASAARCRLPPGGAGRIRWIYPRAGHEEPLLAAMRDLLGADAIVCHRDELAHDLPGCGEVVMIATGSAFPVPDPAYVYEHGSFTPGEMLVPLALWGPGR